MAVHQIDIKEKDILRDRYEIVKYIDSGGMSKVYLARDVKDEHKEWAVKVTHLEHKMSKQLIQEARLLSELDHPAIPKIADFFTSEDGQYFYLVQEFLDGQTLLQLSDTKRLSVEEVVDYALQLCDVLHYLHSIEPEPIIYKDLKPGNVMIVHGGKVKLIDFGVARRYHKNKLHDTSQVGTVGFAAPEQFEKTQTDQRTDIFSLGAMMYYLLSGGKYVYVSQQPLNAYAEEKLPEKLIETIEKMVALDPKDRLQRIELVQDELQTVFHREKTAEDTVKEKGKGLYWIYIGTGLILLGSVIYFLPKFLF